MKNMRSIRILALLLVGAGSAQGFMRHHNGNGCGPLEAKRWGFMVFGGAAPGLFTHRASPHRNVPRSALSCSPTTPVTIGGPDDPFCFNIYQILTSPEDASQIACPIDPQFSKQFTNAVVHVGGEISYNTCDDTQFFIDVVYNRARGGCFSINDKNFRAPDGCDTCANKCCELSSGTILSQTTLTHNLTNYQAYGFYAGARYYFNRIWCDRVAFFIGLKVGMLHRKAVHSMATTPDISIPIGPNTYVFPSRTFPTTDYCASNAVSGGGQIGFDWCINDCWSIMVGAEVVSTSPFKINPNETVPSFGDPLVNGQPTPAGFGRNFAIPTSIVIGHVGSFLQFPVWLGVRWEFDWCNRDCTPCA